MATLRTSNLAHEQAENPNITLQADGTTIVQELLLTAGETTETLESRIDSRTANTSPHTLADQTDTEIPGAATYQTDSWYAGPTLTFTGPAAAYTIHLQIRQTATQNDIITATFDITINAEKTAGTRATQTTAAHNATGDDLQIEYRQASGGAPRTFEWRPVGTNITTTADGATRYRAKRLF